MTVPPETDYPILEQPIDRFVLETLFDSVADGNPEVMLELIDTFQDECDSRNRDLTRAIHSGDARLAEISAHSLKSSAATFGASELAKYYAELERMAHSGKLESMVSTLAKLMPLYLRVYNELSAERIKILGSLPSDSTSLRDPS